SYPSNGYNSNNSGSYPSNGYNSNNNGSYPSNGYNSNNNGSYPSNGYIGGYSVLDDLPEESKSFNKIINKLQNYTTNNNKHVLNALISSTDRILTNAGDCARTVINSNAVLNEKIELYSETQPFIFFQMNNGDFIIANRGNGLVLQMINDDIDGKIIVSSIYSPNIKTQIFKKYFEKDVNTFRLQTTMDDITCEVNNCHNRSDIQQRITAVPKDRGDKDDREYNFLLDHKIDFPTNIVVNGQPLREPRQLTHSGDMGDEPTPRAIQGNALLPCIIVNDIGLSLDKKIKESPYYILEYTQSWNRKFFDILESGSSVSFPETIGILTGTQEDMRNKIDMTIGGPEAGANWDLTGFMFGNRSLLFANKILSGLNLKATNYLEMGSFQRIINQINTNNSKTTYVRYLKQHEFQLKRLDGTRVGGPWIMVENTAITREYVQN
ncbi:hypothetical protein, partial [Bacillus mycoides]|uniref:hypothetical protein n=1 Tax=Bacillus mycoides TaxID=1405 RepID=UPI003D0332D4